MSNPTTIKVELTKNQFETLVNLVENEYDKHKREGHKGGATFTSLRNKLWRISDKQPSSSHEED